MKKSTILLTIVLVIFVAITIWSVVNYTPVASLEGFAADTVLLDNERRKLQYEGGRRYNDLGRIQAPEANVRPGDVKKAIQQVVPVLSNSDRGIAGGNNESMVKLIQTELGLAAADNTQLIPGNTTQTGVLSQKIAVCEALRVTQEDGCEVLGRPEYNECGICHKDGVDSKGKPVRGVGMFISKDDQIRENQVANTKQTKALYIPTIGKCDPKNFTMAKNHCKKRHNQVACESAGAATLSNQCGYCFGGKTSNGLIYVGPKLQQFDAYLNISHPGTSGSWPLITGSRTPITDATGSYDKGRILVPRRIKLSLKENDLVSIALNGMPDVWCAWLSDDNNTRIVPINVGMSPSSITPEESAYIAGDKRSLRVKNFVSSDPEWGSYSERVPANVLWYRRNMAYEPSTKITLSFNVPATLTGPSPPLVAGTGEGSNWDLFEEVFEQMKQCPAGPMIHTEAGSAMMNANSCFKANGEFNPTLNCMQGLFLGTGGETAGKLYPTTEAAAKELAVNNSLDDTVSFLNRLANIAIYGVNENGAPVDFKTFKDASMKMLGRTPGNPCDMDKDPNNGTVNYSSECLNYLWRTSDKIPGTPEPTFADGSDPTNIPYSKCNANGTMAPLRPDGSTNPAAKKYNTKVSLDAIRADYKKIYEDAQNSTNFDSQVNNIAKCYGASLKAPGSPEVFGVFPGTYTTPRSEAQKVCLKFGSTMATLNQLKYSQAQGADTCATGWVADDNANAYYPITTSTQGGCGNGRTGIIRWTPDSKLAGVYCFGVKPPQGTADVASFKNALWNNPNTQSNPILCPSLPMNPRIQRGNKIGQITGTTRNYILTFDLTPIGIVGNWSSILHFTYTGKDCCSPGDRAPGIWFNPGNTRLHIRMGDTTSGNWGIDTDALPMNVTSKVQIRCLDNNPKITVGSAETSDSNGFWPTYNSVQPSQRPDPAGRALTIYAGDPWYEPAKATIANLVYQIIP